MIYYMVKVEKYVPAAAGHVAVSNQRIPICEAGCSNGNRVFAAL